MALRYIYIYLYIHMLEIAGETAEPNELFLCGKLMGIFGITSAKKFRNIDF